MAEKQYLNYAGLRDYDALIKAWVANSITSAAYDDTAIRNLIASVQAQDEEALQTAVAALTEQISDNETAVQEAIATINEKLGEDAVADQISAAVAAVINSAPETFDTLKEIADWIEEHGESATALIATVAEQGEAIAATNARIDAITAISGTYIEALFLEPVVLEENQSVQDAINALEEGQKLVLTEDVAEDLVIEQDAVIEAEGVEFSGTVTVNEAAAVTVIGATFSGEVIVVA